MRITFSAVATAFSPKTQFPPSLIKNVVVCNNDHHTYQHIENIKDGLFTVDFELTPTVDDPVFSDELKFHFFTGDVPAVVAAGGVPMECIQKTMSDPAHKADYMFSGNFNKTTVHLMFKACESPVHITLPKMTPSLLKATEATAQLFTVMAKGVALVLGKTIEIDPRLGAPMFCNLLTAHNMQNQMTTHMHFQSDVEPTKHDSARFYNSGLTMTALAEALQAQCITAEQATNLPVHSDTFTLFCSAVCQSFTRSAHLCPYWSDMILDDSLDSAGQVKLELGESFKLPLREPFFANKKFANFINADDCEGQATFMLHIFRSFQRLEETYGEENKRDQGFLSQFFPAHQFNMTHEHKTKMFDLALKLGAAIRKGEIRCDIVLLAAGAAALGDETGKGIGGHATCVLVNCSNPDKPVDVLMEGTNSIIADNDKRTLSFCTPNGPMNMSMVQVANLLTKEIAGKDFSQVDSRRLIHINKETSTQFYKTAFCQNGTLLATAKENSQLSYGINMQSIADYNLKVLMPVAPSLLDTLVRKKCATEFLSQYCEARRIELHPPMVPTGKIIEATMAWSPMQAYVQPQELMGREYKVCITTTSYRDPTLRNAALYRALALAEEWNGNPKQQQIGHLAAYQAMDTVYTKLCLWTDKTTQLEQALGHAMCNVDDE